MSAILNKIMFTRKCQRTSDYQLLYIDSGEPVTRLIEAESHPVVWPTNSELSGYHEHPDGILLDNNTVKILNLEIED